MVLLTSISTLVIANPERSFATNCDDQCIKEIICSYPWPCQEAISVVYRTINCPNGESGGHVDVISDDGQNWGLYQINKIHGSRVGWDLSRLLEPDINVGIAFELWSDQGWRPWFCKP